MIHLIMFFDKFVKEYEDIINIENIQLWCVISIHLGLKQEILIDFPILNIENLDQITKNQFSKEDFLKAEEIFIEKLEYNIICHEHIFEK